MTGKSKYEDAIEGWGVLVKISCVEKQHGLTHEIQAAKEFVKEKMGKTHSNRTTFPSLWFEFQAVPLLLKAF